MTRQEVTAQARRWLSRVVRAANADRGASYLRKVADAYRDWIIAGADTAPPPPKRLVPYVPDCSDGIDVTSPVDSLVVDSDENLLEVPLPSTVLPHAPIQWPEGARIAAAGAVLIKAGQFQVEVRLIARVRPKP